VAEGKLYVIGGFYNVSGDATPRLDVYDPVAETWTQLADLPTIVTHHTAALDGDTIWVTGGFFGDHGGYVVNNVQRYSISTDTWTSAPQLPGRRAGGALVVLGRELHFFGGFSTRTTSAADHYVLDLDNVSVGWDSTSFASLPVGRGHLSGAVLNGVIYAIGGQLGHDLNPMDLDLVDAYDPSTNTWHPVANLPEPRSHAEASTYVHDGRIFVAGGRNNRPGGAPALDTVVAYDPVTDSWSSSFPLPLPLIAPSVKPIANGLFLTTGGTIAGTPTPNNYRSQVNGQVGTDKRINSGSFTQSLAEWCEDSFFHGGMAAQSPANPPIAGTTDDTLYYTARTGTPAVPDAFEYHIPAAFGDYRVRLHFAELTWTSIGERVFDVTYEGLGVLEGFDIVAEGGSLTAVVQTFDAHVTDGAIDLRFQASVDTPTVSGIEVLRLPDGTINPYCQGLPNSVGAGARLDLVGSVSAAEDNFRLLASGMPHDRPAAFLVSDGQGSTPIGSGIMCLNGIDVQSSILTTGSLGRVELTAPSAIIPQGIGWNLQVVYLDTFPFHFNFSDALQLFLTP